LVENRLVAIFYFANRIPYCCPKILICHKTQ